MDPWASLGGQGSERRVSSLEGEGACGNRFSKQETAPPMDRNLESEKGGLDEGADSEESGEEPPPASGERRPRARKVRVADRWFDPRNGLENSGKKGSRSMQLFLDIDASLPNGNLIALKVLVYTGPK